MSNLISDVSDDSLEADVLQHPGLVLIDFWAPWCAPCKMIAPMLDEVSREYCGQLKICKLNIDDNQLSAQRFNVRGVPTLVLMRNGKECDRVNGVLSKSRLSALLDKWLEA